MATLTREQKSVTIIYQDGKPSLLIEGNGELHFSKLTPATMQDIEEAIDAKDVSK